MTLSLTEVKINDEAIQQAKNKRLAYIDSVKPDENGMISLWIEGYACTGQSKEAQHEGTYKAETLTDAVAQWAGSSVEKMNLVDFNMLTYWGCRFFDNESDARKLCG